jgi:hypothetical protein
VNVPSSPAQEEKKNTFFCLGRIEKNWAGPWGENQERWPGRWPFPTSQDPKEEEEENTWCVCVYLGAPNHHRCVHHFPLS